MVLIRLATPDDADTVGQLWLELVEFHRQLDPQMPEAAPDGAQRYASRVRYQIDDLYSRIFVAEIDGQVQGYVMAMLVDMLPETFAAERAGFIADIYVREAFRGHRVGRKLVQTCINWFRTREVSHFEWYVAVANTRGVEFWRSVGGRELMMRMRAPIPDDDELKDRKR